LDDDDDEGECMTLEDAIASAVQMGDTSRDRTLEIHDQNCPAVADDPCTCSPQFIRVLARGRA
jgi:hypothetical protein